MLAIGKWLVGLVWISEHKRRQTTAKDIWRAIWLRRLGATIIFVVPLYVSYAVVSPVLLEVTKCADGAFLLSLLRALLLAALYAWYAWFITRLLLFAPRLESLRKQDVVLPVVLATAYLLYALASHAEFLRHFPPQNRASWLV